ncbi:hypothetical protein FN846DRAFT_939743 [Sphaerosporella brunnea]|uniref:Secreted protein n=1 Tax=Sphaerosporella brunnea TaxID=1250544 RepID=A0A5J5F278_9PEZI|nr:hypothetical protein FN846DRAFT_939743 [Sphaerosporella brunnea]
MSWMLALALSFPGTARCCLLHSEMLSPKASAIVFLWKLKEPRFYCARPLIWCLPAIGPAPLATASRDVVQTDAVDLQCSCNRV